MEKVFGSHLRSLRGTMTQTQMASIFNVKQNTYSAWESETKEPSISTVRAICRHFNVSSDWLFGLTDEHEGRHSVTASNSAVAINGNATNHDCRECPIVRAAAQVLKSQDRKKK
jgi:DNA-binding XRE family transcriptional regulator